MSLFQRLGQWVEQLISKLYEATDGAAPPAKPYLDHLVYNSASIKFYFKMPESELPIKKVYMGFVGQGFRAVQVHEDGDFLYGELFTQSGIAALAVMYVESDAGRSQDSNYLNAYTLPKEPDIISYHECGQSITILYEDFVSVNPIIRYEVARVDPNTKSETTCPVFLMPHRDGNPLNVATAFTDIDNYYQYKFRAGNIYQWSAWTILSLPLKAYDFPSTPIIVNVEPLTNNRAKITFLKPNSTRTIKQVEYYSAETDYVIHPFKGIVDYIDNLDGTYSIFTYSWAGEEITTSIRVIDNAGNHSEWSFASEVYTTLG
ncbi:hypothetical protein [Flavobacterium sp.]|jgi:hypothetical protein|uniref:hypothetical protein n=1 Tax=Flavobacterium sp. TaxID=239 RepID=UPI0037BEDC7E